MYKQYGKVISPMGCRAFLSPWYERGGMYPADDKDVPVFVGRFNIGAVSLHLPMILAKARAESRDFYEVLDFYLEMIRNLHIRTYDYLGQMRASTNPLAYCEGGFYGGHLKPNEKIGKILKPMTASFGITALNELQELYNGKSIAEDGQPDAGEVEIGETIRIGYFAQEVPDMDTNQRVIDYIRDVAEYIPTRDGKISATMMLERFLFDSAMQYAPIAKLSGGEKRRLYLLKVLMEAPNVLLLDEPSNDLDIPTLTILEDYLDSFAGIVIAVSHDRYFLDNIVDRIFAFEGNGHLTQYEGGYTDYTEALARKGGAVSEGQSTAVGAEKKKSAQADWKQNRPQKLKFTYKEQREFETIDDDIAALEELLEKLDKDMEANATNSVKLREIMEQKEKAQADLDEKMDRWVYLNDLAERIEAQKSEK